MFRSVVSSLAVLAVLGPSAVVAQVVIDNGTVQLGLNPAGNIVTGGIGLTFLPSLTNPDAGNRGEALAPGCACEGWGLGDRTTGSFGMAGQSFGFNGIATSAITASGTGTHAASSGSSAISVTEILDNELNVLLTQTFAPSATEFLYSLNVDIQNQGAGAIGDLIFRRAMDWDVPPLEFNEYVTIQGWPASALIGSTNDGFSTGNINVPLSVISGAGAVANGNFTNAGPADHGAVFDFSFGELATGETQNFTIFYGAAPSEADALVALGEVGAEVYSLGKVGDDAGRDFGTPHTFIFGFAGVGGVPVTPGGATAPINQFPQLAEVFVGRLRNEASARMADQGFEDMLAAAGLSSPGVDRGRKTINYHLGAFGGSGEFQGTTNNASVDYNLRGLSFALDARADSGVAGMEQALFGAQIGITDASADIGNGGASVDARSLDLALYGRLSGTSNMFAEGILHVGRHDFTQARVGLTDVFTSTPEGRSMGALLRFGQTQKLAAQQGIASQVSWYGELGANRTKIDDFTENNNGLATSSYSDSQTQAGIGLRYETAWQSGDTLGFARVDVAGIFEVGGNDYSATQTTFGGSTLTALADGVDTRGLRLRGTLGMVRNENMRASVEYGGIYANGHARDHKLTASLKFEF